MPIVEEDNHSKKRKRKQKLGKNLSNGRRDTLKANWKDVTPADSLSLLVGSGEGGFVSLEEVDGDIFSEAELGDENGAYLGEIDVDSSGKRPSKIYKLDGKLEKAVPLAGLPTDSLEILTNYFGKKKKKDFQEKLDRKHAVGGDFVQTVGESLSLKRVEESNDTEIAELSPWTELRLHPLLEKALTAQGFKEPTPIQRACIPAAAHQGKDIIGAAETGSGKTLAFGIPILQRLLSEQEKWSQTSGNLNFRDKDEFSHLRALIVTPTRELALQVCDHLRSVAKFTNIRVVPLVGGLSTQKQQRLLKGRPPIIVGTPGRLWELMSSGETHLLELQYLSFFVLDEADRMVEKGHFHELQSIIDMLPPANKHPSQQLSRIEDDPVVTDGTLQVSEAALITSVQNELREPRKRRQTLVFSATLSLPPGFKKKLKKGIRFSQSVSGAGEYSVAYLSEKAGVSRKAAVIDLTSTTIVAGKLEETILECREKEKDMYLYYILKVHGCGRTIVFCTSISALRRVSAILHLLRVPCWSLHAQMQQRQRLKAMDRFRETDDAVLVATDVAARGLDVPDIRTVIHYQLPHSAEMYVHRSGRTARALKDGCSIALISPTDRSKLSALCSSLPKMKTLSKFPINGTYLPAIQRRLRLALQVDRVSRKLSQLKAKEAWFSSHKKELDLEFDEESEKVEDESDMPNVPNLKSLQRELEELLKQPLEPKAFSHRYITGAGITPLVAKQLQEYSSLRSNSRGGKPGHTTQKRRFVVIGQEQIEPLKALQKFLNSQRLTAS